MVTGTINVPAIPPYTALVLVVLIVAAVILGWHDPTLARTLAHIGTLVIAAALEGIRPRQLPIVKDDIQ